MSHRPNKPKRPRRQRSASAVAVLPPTSRFRDVPSSWRPLTRSEYADLAASFATDGVGPCGCCGAPLTLVSAHWTARGGRTRVACPTPGCPAHPPGWDGHTVA
ncbi:unnamed protein product [marine sediment metagenome]|uniref:Uncharacterized protein n=1 Tax=marine sediment metagenome TaxID=412755 RepID=X1FA50_9ZZZZ